MVVLDLVFNFSLASQSMPSEVLCNQLTSMTHALQQAVRIISAPEIRTEQLDATKRTYQDYQVHCRGDHRRATQRSHDIEARKEFIESRNKEKVRKEYLDVSLVLRPVVVTI